VLHKPLRLLDMIDCLLKIVYLQMLRSGRIV